MKTSGLYEYLLDVKSKAPVRDERIKAFGIDFMLFQMFVAVVDWVYVPMQDKMKSIEEIDKWSPWINTKALKYGDPEIKRRLDEGDYKNFMFDRWSGWFIFDCGYGGHNLSLQILNGIYNNEDYDVPRSEDVILAQGRVIYLPSESDAVLIGEGVKLTPDENRLFQNHRKRYV